MDQSSRLPGFEACWRCATAVLMTRWNEKAVRMRHRVMKMKEGRKGALPNQPMERTLSCCALQRRSSARWVDSAGSSGSPCSERFIFRDQIPEIEIKTRT